MSVSHKLVRCTVLSIAAVFATVQPALASPPECTCQDLASIQQDYRNAKTLQLYFELLADHLKDFEQRKAKDAPDDLLLRDLSLGEAQDYRAAYPLGNLLEPVEGYTGPGDIMMEPGTCNQDPDDLGDMDEGSPCRAIADAALNHEAFHRAECNRMGPDTYWKLMPSDIALEEVEAYRRQAQELKDELRRVLDVAEVTYTADWQLEINVQGMAEYGYSYSARTEDIGNATGGDTWTMTGEGESTVRWTKAMIAGMACTPSGAVNTVFNTKMTTDGLVFSLEVEELSSSGALGISCPGGGGGGGPVAEAGGGGEVARDLPLNAGSNPLPGDMGSEIRAIMAGMGTVSGEGTRALSVTCEGP